MSPQLFQAIVYMTVSALCFTLLNSVVRYVDHLPTFELVFFRSIGTVSCCLVVIAKERIPILGNNKKLLLLRGLLGFTSLSLFFKAVQMMPLGSAVSLRYLSPFFASAMAIVFLGEKMKKIQWMFFVIAFCGVLLLKGFDHRISLAALSAIIGSAFFSGLVYVIIRKLGTSEHPVVIVNYFLTISTIVGGIACLFNWVPPLGVEWVFLISMGFFGFIAQIFMTKALQIVEANLITPFKYIEVIFTLLIAWLVFGEHQTWVALLGMSIIVLALLGNVMSKRKKGHKSAS